MSKQNKRIKSTLSTLFQVFKSHMQDLCKKKKGLSHKAKLCLYLFVLFAIPNPFNFPKVAPNSHLHVHILGKLAVTS